MIVRLRQLFEELHHRILFIPLVCVLLAIPLSQLSLWIDRQVDDALAVANMSARDRAVLASLVTGDEFGPRGSGSQMSSDGHRSQT